MGSGHPGCLPPRNVAPKDSGVALDRAGRRQATAEADAIEFIIGLVYDRARIRLHDGKQALIRARLGKRLRHLGLTSLVEYCALLQQAEGEEEITHTIDALTTNFTHFLREEDHFRFLVGQALPAMLGRQPRRFGVWSAACATGEEPYSMAFYLEEHFASTAGWDWRVLATDISTKALGKARDAIYAEDRLQTLPAAWLRKYFQQGHGSWAGHFRVKRQWSERVTFRQLNLLGTYDFGDQFEVIFCRNVMIYFDRPTQEQLVRRLSQHLVPGGYLLIGHSESLNGLNLPVRFLRPSIYQKL